MAHQHQHAYEFPFEIRHAGKPLASYDGTDASYESARKTIIDGARDGKISPLREACYLTMLKNAQGASSLKSYIGRQRDVERSLPNEEYLDAIVDAIGQKASAFDLGQHIWKESDRGLEVERIAAELNTAEENRSAAEFAARSKTLDLFDQAIGALQAQHKSLELIYQSLPRVENTAA